MSNINTDHLGVHVKACPVCGFTVEHNCYHGGMSVLPESMPAWKAASKLTDSISIMQTQLQAMIAERDELKNL
jgi:hypothetical protein